MADSGEVEVPRKKRRTGGPESEGEGVAGEDTAGPKATTIIKFKKPVDPNATKDASADGGAGENTSNSQKRKRESPGPGGEQDSLNRQDFKATEVLPAAGKVIAGQPHVVQQKVVVPHESVTAIAAVQRGELPAIRPSADNISQSQAGADAPAAPDQPVESVSHKVQKEQNNDSIAEPKDPPDQPKDPAAPPEGASSRPAVPAAEPPKAPALTQEVYRVPSHAGWFRWDSIHELEKHGVPEFFNGRSPSKTPKVYKEYRDFIITKFREGGNKKLTFTEVRSKLVGDVNVIRRVFDFLEQWGLINYLHSTKPDPKQLPPAWPGVPTTAVEPAPQGLRLVAPAISPVASLYQFEKPKAPTPSTRLSGGLLYAGVPSHKHVFSSASAAAAGLGKGPAVEYHCNSCGSDCSKRRYHNQKQADFDLCPKCFGDGRLGPGMTLGDFIPMDATTAGSNGNTEEWTDQETLLLLEGLELFGDNWQEVAEHVATKSKAQCILHFLQLPIEDPFLEELEQPDPANATTLKTPSASSTQGPEANGKEETAIQAVVKAASEAEERPGLGEDAALTPFADAGNPVMAQVAFLAAMVGPQVAAAAAQAALAALTQAEPSVKEAVEAAITPETKPQADQDNPQPMDVEAQVTEDGQAKQAEAPNTSQPDEQQEEAKPAEGPVGASGADQGGQQVPSGKGAKVGPSLDQAPSAVQVKAAAATALAAAAVKAKLLADQEEREIQRIVGTVIEAQLKKIEIKLRHFDELEELLEKERAQVERSRQNLYAERVRLAASRIAAQASTAQRQPL